MRHQIQSYFILFTLIVYSGQGLAVTLKIATLAPAGTSWMKEMKKGASLIEEKTNGRVKLKYYPGGVMGSERTVHRKIKAGQLHGGAFSSGGLAEIYPDIQCLNLPMLFNSFEEVDYVRAQMESIMKRNLEERGFVLLSITEGGFTRILSKQPMKDLESIRASKVWAPEGDILVREAYNSMGLKPVTLPIADVYTGLQTGLLDTVTITASAAIAFQWHSSTAYVTDTPLIYLVGLLAIQKKAFDRISVEDQNIVRDVVGDVSIEIDKLTRIGNVKAAEALKQQGIEFVKPDAEEIARWRVMADQSIENLIAGGAITRPMVNQVKTILNDYRIGAVE
jgi:TRAP-type C4-dicarboxylate transport system substrate-binding protein